MRIPSTRVETTRYITYGEDNLYPQRIEQVMLMSPITKGAVGLLSNFVRGDGFERGDQVVNELGETANEILEHVSNDMALYNGYALHINSNALGRVTEIRHIPFEYVRLGLPNQSGMIRDVRVSNNWESWNESTLPADELNVKRYRIFDGSENAMEALAEGNGMVLYNTPKRNCYPISTVDAIIETAQTDASLAQFEYANTQNGFLGASVFKYPSSMDSEKEIEALQRKLQELKGAWNANSIFAVEIDEDYEGGSLIEPIPALNNDTLFTNTTLNVKNRILQNYGVPASLMGIVPDGFIFSAQQIQDDYTYMNLRTKDIRNKIQRQFEKFGLDLGDIIPNQFESSQMLDNAGQDTNNESAVIPSEGDQ